MSVMLSYDGYEYAMVAPDEPDIKSFVGYRDGMEELPDGTFTPGTYVVGSNNGWVPVGSRGAVTIYARRIPS